MSLVEKCVKTLSRKGNLKTEYNERTKVQKKVSIMSHLMVISLLATIFFAALTLLVTESTRYDIDDRPWKTGIALACIICMLGCGFTFVGTL